MLVMDGMEPGQGPPQVRVLRGIQWAAQSVPPTGRPHRLTHSLTHSLVNAPQIPPGPLASVSASLSPGYVGLTAPIVTWGLSMPGGGGGGPPTSNPLLHLAAAMDADPGAMSRAQLVEQVGQGCELGW